MYFTVISVGGETCDYYLYIGISVHKRLAVHELSVLTSGLSYS